MMLKYEHFNKLKEKSFCNLHICMRYSERQQNNNDNDNNYTMHNMENEEEEKKKATNSALYA